MERPLRVVVERGAGLRSRREAFASESESNSDCSDRASPPGVTPARGTPLALGALRVFAGDAARDTLLAWEFS